MQISLQFDEFFDRKKFKILILRRFENFTKTSDLKLVGTHCILTWPQIYFRPFRLSLSFNPLSSKCDCWCLFDVILKFYSWQIAQFSFIRALLQNRSILLCSFLFWVNAPVTNIVLWLKSQLSFSTSDRERKENIPEFEKIEIKSRNIFDILQFQFWVLTIRRPKQSKLA